MVVMAYSMAGNMNVLPWLKDMVRRSFGARIVREWVVNAITLAITLLMYFVGKNIFMLLSNLALRIPF